ncbi:hypothetical protein AYI68_g4034 [Smittium mucronatum]|uniref:Uncharacterized protein n=1 Tax=Smittium mucronatum TaxID=133383 RepID=A0A1R0GY71_9FUNG|nr:hypothetical protein AYI68_g4034 [Smittium mucronatum]
MTSENNLATFSGSAISNITDVSKITNSPKLSKNNKNLPKSEKTPSDLNSKLSSIKNNAPQSSGAEISVFSNNTRSSTSNKFNNRQTAPVIKDYSKFNSSGNQKSIPSKSPKHINFDLQNKKVSETHINSYSKMHEEYEEASGPITSSTNHLDVLAYVTMNSPSINRSTSPNIPITPVKLNKSIKEASPNQSQPKNGLFPVIHSKSDNFKPNFSLTPLTNSLLITTPISKNKPKSIIDESSFKNTPLKNESSDSTQSEDEESWQRRSTKARRLLRPFSASRSPESINTHNFHQLDLKKINDSHQNLLTSPTVLAKPKLLSRIDAAHIPPRNISSHTIISPNHHQKGDAFGYTNNSLFSKSDAAKLDLSKDNDDNIYSLEISNRDKLDSARQLYISKTPLRFKHSSLSHNPKIPNSLVVDRSFLKSNSFNTPVRTSSYYATEPNTEQIREISPSNSPTILHNAKYKKSAAPTSDDPFRAFPNHSKSILQKSSLKKRKKTTLQSVDLSHHSTLGSKIQKSTNKEGEGHREDRVDGDTTETDEECANLPPFSPIPLNKKRNSFIDSASRDSRYPMSEIISRKSRSIIPEFVSPREEPSSNKFSSENYYPHSRPNPFGSPCEKSKYSRPTLQSPTPMPHFNKASQFSTPQHSKKVIKIKVRQLNRQVANNFSSDEDRSKTRAYINPPLHNIRKSSSQKTDAPTPYGNQSSNNIHSSTNFEHNAIDNHSRIPSDSEKMTMENKFYKHPRDQISQNRSRNTTRSIFREYTSPSKIKLDSSRNVSKNQFADPVFRKSSSGDTTETDDDLVTKLEVKNNLLAENRPPKKSPTSVSGKDLTNDSNYYLDKKINRDYLVSSSASLTIDKNFNDFNRDLKSNDTFEPQNPVTSEIDSRDSSVSSNISNIESKLEKSDHANPHFYPSQTVDEIEISKRHDSLRQDYRNHIHTKAFTPLADNNSPNTNRPFPSGVSANVFDDSKPSSKPAAYFSEVSDTHTRSQHDDPKPLPPKNSSILEPLNTNPADIDTGNYDTNPRKKQAIVLNTDNETSNDDSFDFCHPDKSNLMTDENSLELHGNEPTDTHSRYEANTSSSSTFSKRQRKYRVSQETFIHPENPSSKKAKLGNIANSGPKIVENPTPKIPDTVGPKTSRPLSPKENDHLPDIYSREPDHQEHSCFDQSGVEDCPPISSFDSEKYVISTTTTTASQEIHTHISGSPSSPQNPDLLAIPPLCNDKRSTDQKVSVPSSPHTISQSGFGDLQNDISGSRYKTFQKTTNPPKLVNTEVSAEQFFESKNNPFC